MLKNDLRYNGVLYKAGKKDPRVKEEHELKEKPVNKKTVKKKKK